MVGTGECLLWWRALRWLSGEGRLVRPRRRKVKADPSVTLSRGVLVAKTRNSPSRTPEHSEDLGFDSTALDEHT